MSATFLLGRGRLVRVCLLGLLVILCTNTSGTAQGLVNACGQLEACVEPGVQFIPAGSPYGYVLSNYGTFQDGDTVRVVGVPSTCVNFCFAACLRNWWIGQCCEVSITGDADGDAVMRSSDIICLVNFAFKGGSAPVPCTASGDVNCSGVVTSADIIYLVNYVFKSGPLPCDVCTLIPVTWTCP